MDPLTPVTVDAVPPPVAVETPKPPDPAVSESIAAVTIAQRNLSREQAKLRKEKAEVSAEREKVKMLLEGDLTAIAKARGVDPNELYRQHTDQLLGREKTPADALKAIQAEVEGLKKQREDEATKAAQAAQQAEAQGRVRTAADFITGKPEFEYSQKLGQAAAIEIYREKQGVTLEEAAKAIETYLEAEIDKLTGYEKFKTKHVAKAAPTIEAVKNEVDAALAARQPTKVPKTLTNAQASEPIVKVASKRMTEEERYQRSIDMIKIIPSRDS